MKEKNRTREQIIALIKRVPESFRVFSDNRWEYPLSEKIQNRDQGHNIMLDAMFQIERRPGILIYIPGVTLESIESEETNGN